MLDLTFAEQVKIILSRKGMTIKELAETIEKRTGKKMSRQNLTQRLGRDNFQEQDMRMIAEILGCPFRLSILGDSAEIEKASEAVDIEPSEKELEKIEKAKERKQDKKEKKESLAPKATEAERDMTIGELMDIHKELDELMEEGGEPEDEVQKGPEQKNEEIEQERARKKARGWRAYLQRITHKEDEAEDDYIDFESSVYEEAETDVEYEEAILQEPQNLDNSDKLYDEGDTYEDEDLEIGELNPQTGHEYETNSVRVHPKRIGYVQVYDRSDHRWTDMTEWAFLGYQERKKSLLGKDYEPPIYLD